MRTKPGELCAVDAQGVADLEARRRAILDPLMLTTCDGSSVSLAGFYRKRSVFLIGGGPSLREMDLSPLSTRGIVTAAMNNAWLVHRPNLWFSVDDANRFADTGWKDPGIWKFVPARRYSEKLGVMDKKGDEWKRRQSAYVVHQMPGVFLFPKTHGFNHETFLDEKGVNWGCEAGEVCSLGLSGYRSVMLASLRILHYLGFARVYIIGADFNMTTERPYAFGQERTEAIANRNNGLFETLNKRLAALDPIFRERGFDVFNATPGGNLTAFRRISFKDAVAKASSECTKEVPEGGWYG